MNNIDWPTRKGAPAEVQKEEFIAQLEEITEMGMNAVVVQIKPTADSFYPSEYGPWSEYLTGVQGQDPGYDPLAFMVGEAHKRNLEFHAWVNPYRITMNHTDLNRLAAGHPARENPEWTVAYGNQLYFDPGIPAVQQFLINGVNEIVANYDVDAIHMDDYFYPYPIAGVPFPDNSSFAEYGEGFSNRADWRRNNVNTLVSSIQQSIKAEKSHVKFGISLLEFGETQIQTLLALTPVPAFKTMMIFTPIQDIGFSMVQLTILHHRFIGISDLRLLPLMY